MRQLLLIFFIVLALGKVIEVIADRAAQNSFNQHLEQLDPRWL